MYLHGLNNVYAVTVMDVETAVTAEIVPDVETAVTLVAVDVVAVDVVAVDVVAIVAEMVMGADVRMLKYQMTILRPLSALLLHHHRA